MSNDLTATFIIPGKDPYFDDPRRIAIEDELVWARDNRISVVGKGNGAVIREKDGSESSLMRMSMGDVLRVADEHDPLRKRLIKCAKCGEEMLAQDKDNGPDNPAMEVCSRCTENVMREEH